MHCGLAQPQCAERRWTGSGPDWGGESESRGQVAADAGRTPPHGSISSGLRPGAASIRWQKAPFILELLAGLFYVAAAIRLLMLSACSGQRPEWLLGLTFLLMGVSYVFYEIPFALQSEALLNSFSVAGRAFYDASVITIAMFTQHVFHRDEDWTRWMLGSIIALLCVGLTVSGLYGDWEGMAPLSNPGFWFEWLDQSIPCAWVGAVAFAEYAKARRRLHLGLSDRMVCNRYLLFGLFGLLQLSTLALLIPVYIDFETNGTWNAWADRVLGSLEIMTIGATWLAFFPPALYRDWLRGAATAETGGED